MEASTQVEIYNEEWDVPKLIYGGATDYWLRRCCFFFWVANVTEVNNFYILHIFVNLYLIH